MTVSGWAIDQAAPSGTGVDAVDVYAYPNADETQTPVFLGAATYGIWRSDIAAAYGNQFGNSHYTLTATLPGPGTWRITARARVLLAGGFSTSASRTVTVGATPRMWIDTPANGEVSGTFTVAGWAIDAGAGSGTGVDIVQVYAYPNPGSGQPAIFLGTASYGSSRPDVAASFGTQFDPSGYGLTASLAAGSYQLVVFARSTVTWTFNQSQSAFITVVTGPQGAVQAPAHGATVGTTFTLSGWAIDASSGSGTGVATVHVWAYPTNGSPAIFAGVATYGTTRSEIGARFQHSRFTPSGFTLTTSALPPGTYTLAAFPYSTVAGGFTAAMTLTVTVQ